MLLNVARVPVSVVRRNPSLDVALCTVAAWGSK
jgi:hypothetical protein